MARWLAIVLLMASPAPKTRQDNVRETLHGVEIRDPYRWLEDQESKETRAWIDEQNRHTRSVLDPLPGRDRLRKRAGELVRTDQLQGPYAVEGRYFLMRRTPDQEQFSILMRRGLEGADEVLVDPSKLDKDANVSVNIAGLSEDGKFLAYAVQQGGKDEHAVRILDVDAGRHLSDELPEGKWGSIAFTRDRKRFFYSRYGDANPRVYEHVVGKPVKDDRDIFGQGYGSEHILECQTSENGRWLLVTVYVGASEDVTELHVKDLQSNGGVLAITKGIEAAFLGEIAGDRLYVKTNWKAPKWRVLEIDLTKPAQRNWREVIAQADAVIDTTRLAGGRILVHYLENVRSRVKVFRTDGKLDRELALPALGSLSGLSGRWKSPELFYQFVSFHIPAEIHHMNLRTGKTKVWFKQRVPVAADDFEVNQAWYNSKDGTRVPMFLVHLKALAKDSNRPVLLTGYGGFNISNTPYFSAASVMFAEQGGVFALANLRGGSEFGEEWHRAGMLDRKQNVFDDFLAAAEYLIREGYTNPARLAIQGGSNGGLLVGAAMTQRPDLFRAVVCNYPLLDMLRYHQFLVAKFWVPEYGSSQDPKQFEYLRKYSPYHNVKPGAKYPAVMFVTGDSDTRVAPLHARKMAALMQSVNEQPALLHYDTTAGHSGGRPAAKTIDDLVDTLSFLFWQLGAEVR